MDGYWDEQSDWKNILGLMSVISMGEQRRREAAFGQGFIISDHSLSLFSQIHLP
jgi:hypothetical protein